MSPYINNKQLIKQNIRASEWHSQAKKKKKKSVANVFWWRKLDLRMFTIFSVALFSVGYAECSQGYVECTTIKRTWKAALLLPYRYSIYLQYYNT